MIELTSFQDNLLHSVTDTWHRYLYNNLWDDQKLLGISGLRGTGKTTILLQYLKYRHRNPQSGLYVTLDHPYFYQHTLFDLAGEWYRHGGELLLIDEIHKYANWSRELKLIYDGYPDLRVIFTASSALDLFRGESDLSRRLLTQTLRGLSFREYLEFVHGVSLPVVSLDDLMQRATEYTQHITQHIKPLPLFKTYLRSGYFPFSKAEDPERLMYKLMQIINTVLETDLAYVQNYSAAHVHQLKKLLGVIADSAPYQPNISNLARELGMSRDTIYQFLKHLHDAQILVLVHKKGKGSTVLQKPDKVYIENTNFSYALKSSPNPGALRETFLINQLLNAGHNVHLAEHADFHVDDQWMIEVGGKAKKRKRSMAATNIFLVMDDIDAAAGNSIPLWLFGFLY